MADTTLCFLLCLMWWKKTQVIELNKTIFVFLTVENLQSLYFQKAFD
ncbi:MAG: hypothetical protein JWP12_116 [Bacteroidetes bacterium]|nr:hypothetical protein [Bacteroidota bacterium]